MPHRDGVAWMSEQENKELVRRFLHEAWNQNNVLIINELLSPAYCRHIATDPYLLSRTAQREMIERVHRAFPNLRLTVEDVIAEDDRVVFRGTLRGTQLHRFRNVDSTRKELVLMIIGIVRIEDGVIVEQWGGVNELDLLRQLTSHFE